MITSGDPLRDFDRHDEECEKALQKLPVCDECGEPINEDEYYDVYGEILCWTCLKAKFQKWTEDYE